MENPRQKNSRVLSWSLTIAILIVLNLFYNYSLSLIFSSPQYADFCPTEQVTLNPQTENECTAIGGSWTAYPKPMTDGTNQTVTGYCNPSFTCQNKFDAASKNYDRNVFISLVVLGVITFALALVFRNMEILSTALSLGAVLDLVIASIRYWRDADGIIKVFILAVALAALIYLSVRRFGNKIQP